LLAARRGFDRRRPLTILFEADEVQTGDHGSGRLAQGFAVDPPRKSAFRQTFVTLENVIASIVSHRCTGVEHADAIRNTRRATPLSKSAIC
jgi:hypothetical protein